MEITGRLTADANIHTTSNDKKVVNFSVAVNDSYKNKEGERITQTEYFRCAFWLGTNVAKVLTKGTIVNLSGRAYTDAWIGADGEAKAAMNFSTSNIKILGGGSRTSSTEGEAAKPNGKRQQAAQSQAHNEAGADLPF